MSAMKLNTKTQTPYYQSTLETPLGTMVAVASGDGFVFVGVFG